MDQLRQLVAYVGQLGVIHSLFAQPIPAPNETRPRRASAAASRQLLHRTAWRVGRWFFRLAGFHQVQDGAGCSDASQGQEGQKVPLVKACVIDVAAQNTQEGVKSARPLRLWVSPTGHPVHLSPQFASRARSAVPMG